LCTLPICIDRIRAIIGLTRQGCTDPVSKPLTRAIDNVPKRNSSLITGHACLARPDLRSTTTAWKDQPVLRPRPFSVDAMVLIQRLDAGVGAGAAVRVASNMALAIKINMVLSPVWTNITPVPLMPKTN